MTKQIGENTKKKKTIGGGKQILIIYTSNYAPAYRRHFAFLKRTLGQIHKIIPTKFSKMQKHLSSSATRAQSKEVLRVSTEGKESESTVSDIL